jgi:8-amino-7-oxononanoate synthase
MSRPTQPVKDLFARAEEFSGPDSRLGLLQAHGAYPFFKEFSGYDRCDAPAEIRMGDRTILMFGSNNYLGLTTHPKVKEAAVNAVRRHGTGCSGSRWLNGTLELHTRLEHELADFLGYPAALLFGTGFQTNQGALSVLAGHDDCIFADRQVHASLLDGMQTSAAKCLRFRHNDLDHLEALLAARGPHEGRLVIIDGVYSMEGDLCDLPGLLRLVRKYAARLYLDEAHALGVLGEHGRGTAEHFGLEMREVDIYAGTFSKSLAAAGGFIAARKDVIDYVKHHSRAFTYSASMPPASLAAVLAALEIVRTEPERRRDLLRISAVCRAELKRAGFEVHDGFTPIIPVVVDDELLTGRLCNALVEEGVYVNPVLPPATTRSLLRISCMAVHTEDHVAQMVEALIRAARRLDALELLTRGV